MTLIITVLTDNYVALVSDRRTTWVHGDRITRQEDTDIKTFNLFGQFLMGFTGLARIDGLRVERWVSKVLSGVPTHEYFNVLTKEIDAAFRIHGHSGKIPHAFLASGYANLTPGGHIYPMNVVISNSIDQDGVFSKRALSDNFRIFIDPIGNRARVIRSVGWAMRENTMRALEHRIRVVTKGEPSNPSLSIGPLVTALRDTARHSMKHVGSAALFTSLPRCAAPCASVTMGQVDFRQTTAALFLPEGVRSVGEATMYAPACIGPQLHIMGIKVYSGKPSAPLGQEEGWC